MCGINPICYVQEALSPFWAFIVWGFWIVVALIALGVLAKLKEIGGWPAVWAAVTAGLTLFAWQRGRRGESLLPFPVEGIDERSPDVARPRPGRTFTPKRLSEVKPGERYWDGKRWRTK